MINNKDSIHSITSIEKSNENCKDNKVDEENH